ncbi:hypothetical protein HPB50_018011 [Hyalomma asiaticum]|uniref:Uncharacterized protein n=1 Tax=Hyalomma asiaticum TaxID=266040 RepID=A0ACB7S7A4_HYAAI|nr:hypothetical protein HPB50_018011 [Hyalomma asiaticum]
MEKIKAKRTVRRRQNTVIINEATAALETADAEELAAILHRLEISNGELRKLNEEMEVHIAADAFEDEYTETSSTQDGRCEENHELRRSRLKLLRAASSLRNCLQHRRPSPPCVFEKERRKIEANGKNKRDRTLTIKMNE